MSTNLNISKDKYELVKKDFTDIIEIIENTKCKEELVPLMLLYFIESGIRDLIDYSGFTKLEAKQKILEYLNILVEEVNSKL